MDSIFKFKFKHKFHCQLKKKKVRKFVSKSRNRNGIGEKLQTVAAIIESNQSACVLMHCADEKVPKEILNCEPCEFDWNEFNHWMSFATLRIIKGYQSNEANERIEMRIKKQTELKWKRRINRNQAVTSH